MMERLTDKYWRNFDPWECCGQDKYCQRGCHDPGGCTNGCIVPKLYCRLAAYEDAEQVGQLVIFPCKVGDIVWLVNNRFFWRDKSRLPLVCCRVNEFSNDGTHTYMVLDDAETWFSIPRFRAVRIEDFGKIIFKTKEEAEATLMKKGD